MGDVVNLTRARKIRARADKARVADANRAKFGRSKAQKLADAIDRDQHDNVVDGAFREGHVKKDRDTE